MPKVSVIVPNYNHARFLPYRLDSIFNQNYQDFEVILLDDCSTDDSRDILEQYQDHPKVSTVFFNELNSGSTFKQWQKGIALSTGDYIWIAESDDYCESNFLSELVSILDTHPNVGISYCQSRSVDQNNKPLNSWLKQTTIFSPNLWNLSFIANGKTVITNCLIHRNVIPNASAIVFRKSVYGSTSGIDTTMTLNGDWLLWIKMLELSDLAYCVKEFNYFRQHSNKATGVNTRNYNGLKEQFELYVYIQEKLGITNKQKREMTNAISRRWLFQMATGSIILGIKNIPKVTKAAFSFNKYFYFNLLFVALHLIVFRVILQKKADPIDISEIIVDKLI
ncbi:MAG: glycosyltransferase family 2 protein [Prolixibacteraceae bacterium]|nr:glycosyltransferase family 2 protein [Prolixibacteraceae bacterium]